MTEEQTEADVGGHNSINPMVKSIVQRVERLEEEKKALVEDIKEVFGEAKGNGLDVKILRKVIALRKREAADLSEEEKLIDLYLRACGTRDQ